MMILIAIGTLFVGCQQVSHSNSQPNGVKPEVAFPVGQDAVLAQWAVGEPERIGGEFRFTEGPTWTQRGTLVFSDIPANKLYEWDGKTLSVLVESSGNANGTTQDKDGNVYVCHHGTRQVTLLSPNKKSNVLANDWEGKKLNSPNDIAISPQGTVFFTDPTYGLPRGEEPAYGAKNVFMIKDGKCIKVMKGIDQPNGLVFSPDGKRLYVADSGASRIDVLDMNGDEAGKPQLLCEVPSPDGIRVDEAGNIWAACGDGVRVISPKGMTLGTIKFPQQPANLCFGEDGKTLFVTARTGVYKVKVTMKGVMPGF